MKVGAVAACFWNGVKFLPTSEVTSCLESIPFNAAWRDGTVASLKKLLPNYVLVDSLTDTGPPANIQVDLMSELDKIGGTDFERDSDMQSAFAKLFLSAHDTHTKYVKCDAYHNIYYSQPFQLRVTAEGPSQKFFFGEEAKEGLLDHLDKYSELSGMEVLAIDGVAPVTAITHFADEFIARSQDQGTRFNVALFRGYFMTRFIEYHDVPKGSVEYLLRNHSATPPAEVTVSLPWTAVAVNSDKDVNISVANCAVEQGAQRLGRDTPKRAAGYRSEPVESVPGESSEPSKWTEVISKSPLKLYFNEDNSVGVFKLSSFSPDNKTEHCEDWQRAFTMMAERNTQYLIIDLLKNGGGTVCLGYNLLRQLVPDELLNAPPSVYEGAYDLPWTPEMSAAVQSSATARDMLDLEDYIDAETGLRILENDTASFYDGGGSYIRGKNLHSRRTKKFYLDCDTSETYIPCLARPPIVFPKERLLVLSDGYCGSTCATFMHRLQAGGYATVAGVGGIKHMPMSTSSFAGGFVGDIDDINDVVAEEDRIPEYPTSGGVFRFAWAEVYDYGRKETPAQYAWSQPDIRLDFWDFNGDLGPLYDMASATIRPSTIII